MSKIRHLQRRNFSELSDKEKKVARKKFRNTILSLSESLTQEKDKTRLEKLKKRF